MNLKVIYSRTKSMIGFYIKKVIMLLVIEKMVQKVMLAIVILFFLEDTKD